MTDPVDMDALTAAWRAKREHYAAIGISPSAHMSFFDGFTAAHMAAADEVDRLRDIIAGAPHAGGCRHVEWDADGLLRVGRCTC